MPALGSEGSPSARVRILSTIRVLVGLPHSEQRFPSGDRFLGEGIPAVCRRTTAAASATATYERKATATSKVNVQSSPHAAIHNSLGESPVRKLVEV
ncbi:hypothetical protein E2C01_067486 [Portunus trituberculatus]|uniref:Uncharacterized protein n=1 Tax=Portunus trituberculatus TaxID=210409 RepID=A0A5B7HWU9_PORTR|nr:hypothetical protein [Portunus trituberculatus]